RAEMAWARRDWSEYTRLSGLTNMTDGDRGRLRLAIAARLSGNERIAARLTLVRSDSFDSPAYAQAFQMMVSTEIPPDPAVIRAAARLASAGQISNQASSASSKS
ncbi:MAG: hypothetical protein WA979_02825, partial [Pacificimonas sp.]